MADPHHAPALDDRPWSQLFHRWFIQYNPLYLVSAALVLVGVILLSQGLGAASTVAQMGITSIAEIYAWALIGGAALLVRIGLRRPAVMLALLAALYQCDLTLHTETCAHLGLAGALGSVVWLASFIAKLRTLAWAMQMRLSRSALVVASLGAAMITVFPWLARVLEGSAASSLLAGWLFALFATALWTTRRVDSRVRNSDWADTVSRRSLRATWAGWTLMTMVHVGFWLTQSPSLEAIALLPAALLLSTRLARRESTTWLIVAGTLAYTGVVLPALLSVTAVMAAVTLGLRALRNPVRLTNPAAPSVTTSDDAYRTEPTEPADATAPTPPPTPKPIRWAFVMAEPEARQRLLLGAAGCLYLAGWTQGWSAGPWPPHVWWVDLLLVVASLAFVASTKLHVVLVLPALALGHLVVSLQLVPMPRSVLQWGIACVGVGFGLLLVLLMASVRWRRRSLTP